jgi:predicted dehydrogenase
LTSSQRLGYAVIGLGHIAQHAVLPAFKHSKKSRLVAVVSSSRAKARRLARQFGAPLAYTYDEYNVCLANDGVQAVFIAGVNAAHAPQTIRAAAAGKHVLCEKPMANTVDDCLRMVDACRKSTVKLMIAYRKYFEPSTVTLKSMISKGRMGRLRIMHSSFTFNLRPDKTWHVSQEVAGGGSLVDVGVYCVNTMRWLAGELPVEASARAWVLDAHRFGDVDESMAFQLRFPSGLVTLASSSFAAAKSSFLHVHGAAGWATIVPAYSYTEERRLIGQIGARWFDRRYPIIDEFALELDALADCVRRNCDPEPDGLEGARDVAIMQAIYRAAKSGKPTAITPIG